MSSEYQTRLNMLDASKRRHRAYLERGEIERANSEVREGSRICDRLGKNVIAEFYHLVCDTDTTTKVLELKELVQNNLIKCPKCDLVAKSTQSMNSHWGKKHKIK